MTLGRWLYKARLRLRSLFAKAELEQDLDDELQHHLDAKMRQYVARGLDEAAARRRALSDLGDVARTKEYCRDARGIGFVETLVQDLRYATRTLWSHPGYSAVVVLTLALGLGANTAVFSVVDTILIAPLPYPQPNRLVQITGTYPKGAFVALRDEMRAMDVAAYAEGHELNLSGDGEPVRVSVTRVSAELFSVLGARPALGRVFAPGEDRAGQDHHVILSHAAWEQRFGKDPAIAGRHIRLDGVSREIVGVMPASFRFPSARTEFWIPLHIDPRDAATHWGGDYMPIVGRLREGVTIEQARGAIRVFQSRVSLLFPWKMPDAWNRDISAVPLHTGLVGDTRTRLLLLLGAVAVVLLIACANVANLTLARAAARDKEMTIRAALGAGRRRIARQLITESVFLACLGGAVGWLVATLGLSLVKAWLPADTPRLTDVQMAWRVLLFTGALTIVTGLAFGLVPALHISRTRLTDSLKSGGRGAASVPHRLRGALVVAEIACAVLLVIAAGLLIRSFYALSRIDPGFRSDHVVTARLTPNESFCGDASRCLTFYRTVLDEIRNTPGVGGVALVNTPPLGGHVAKRSLDVLGFTTRAGETAPLVWLNIVTADYFHVMDIQLIEGAAFAQHDTSGPSLVAIVSTSTARRFWPDQPAIGKQIRFVGEADWRTVVGVAADVRGYDLERDEPRWMQGTVYVPHNVRATVENGRLPSAMSLVLETPPGGWDGGASIRRSVARVTADVAVSEIRPLGASLSDARAVPASTAAFFGAFAGVALVLGLIGIYGVLSFLVSNRTREIGIRIALGAPRRRVLALVMGEGAKLALIGIAVGSAAAVALGRLLATELHGVSPLDPVTYAAVALMMAIVTLLACGVPTRRAMRVDPLIALREER